MFGQMMWGGRVASVPTNDWSPLTKLLLHFDGTVKDECGHTTSRYSTAAISLADSKFGSGCLSNVGSNACVQVAAASDLQPGNQSISFECWVKPSSSLSGENATFYSCGAYNGDQSARLQFWHSNRQLRISYGALTASFSLDALPQPGVWTHMWFWVDKTASINNKVGIHLGGTKLQQVASDGPLAEDAITACDTFTIGAWRTAGQGVSYRYNGLIDDVRLIIGELPYSTTGNITVPQRHDDPPSFLSPYTYNPLRFTFDLADGASPYVNEGLNTLGVNVGYGTLANGSYPTVSNGKLISNGGYILAASGTDHPLFNIALNQWRLSFDVWSDDYVRTCRPIMFGPNGSNSSLQVYISDRVMGICPAIGGIPDAQTLKSTTPLQDNTSYRVVLEQDAAGVLYLYLNEVLDSQLSNPYRATGIVYQMCIGGDVYYPPFWFGGTLDNVMFECNFNTSS